LPRGAQLLAAWMNSYLHADKMYVRDITEDLQDGQLLLSFLGWPSLRRDRACARV
jgi:hypothetical protein